MKINNYIQNQEAELVSEKPNEECGLFGIYSKKSSTVGADVLRGLYALQHRGQESCGITVNEDGIFLVNKGLGLVSEVFGKNATSGTTSKKTLSANGQIAIGHVRYSTANTNDEANIQPMVIRHIKGKLAVAHNGNLVNGAELRREFENKGAIFHSTNDSEVISYLITEGRILNDSVEDAVEYAMSRLKGAYSLVIMSPKKLILARDPYGFRPLSIGKIPSSKEINGQGVLEKDMEVSAYVVASETCAFDCVGAIFERDVKPGEIVVISENSGTTSVRSITTNCGRKGNMCIFEYIYFARPDSIIAGKSVQESRIRAGEILFKEHPQDADIVVGVPESGLDSAIGYSRASGIPFALGLIKNRYIARTFIMPAQSERENSVRMKLNPVSAVLKGKRVILLDDSIVRGTTTAKLVALLRLAGAKEVHLRIASPPFIAPCWFGTDIDDKGKLIATKYSTEEIRQKINADSLGYISIEGIVAASKDADTNFCTGCFTSIYPIDVPEGNPCEYSKDKFEEHIEHPK